MQVPYLRHFNDRLFGSVGEPIAQEDGTIEKSLNYDRPDVIGLSHSTLSTHIKEKLSDDRREIDIWMLSSNLRCTHEVRVTG